LGGPRPGRRDRDAEATVAAAVSHEAPSKPRRLRVVSVSRAPIADRWRALVERHGTDNVEQIAAVAGKSARTLYRWKAAADGRAG